MDVSCCRAWALEHGLGSYYTWILLRSMWNLPRPEIKPTFPGLAGKFLTTAPPGKSQIVLLLFRFGLIHICTQGAAPGKSENF